MRGHMTMSGRLRILGKGLVWRTHFQGILLPGGLSNAHIPCLNPHEWLDGSRSVN